MEYSSSQSFDSSFVSANHSESGHSSDEFYYDLSNIELQESCVVCGHNHKQHGHKGNGGQCLGSLGMCKCQECKCTNCEQKGKRNKKVLAITLSVLLVLVIIALFIIFEVVSRKNHRR
eukprot:TRINITY_DN7663_c3_g1_i1.p1 TRINITY_DN7663_c3_g1~~TRINITY_DN7663_c3_g1_i1.p1  ORF type:complete len:118 (+),score=8.23 TRINITY_DN7663_c3_g1_i1:61-414(+)